jgi:PAS domain S-box-containing protein
VSPEQSDQASEARWLTAALSSVQLIAKTYGLSELGGIEYLDELPIANGGYVTLTGERVSHTLGIAAIQPQSRLLVRAVLGCSPDDPELEVRDMADAMGEIANILSGQVKTLMQDAEGDLVTGSPWFVAGQLWIPFAKVSVARVLLGGIEAFLIVLRHPSSAEHAERRRVETALVDREARLRAILDGVAEGIVTVDEQGNVEALNASGQRMLGWSLSEVVGQPVNVVLGGDIRQRLLRLSTSTTAECVTPASVELSVSRRTAGAVRLELTAAECTLRDQRMIVGIFRDIGARKQLELELRQAQKLESVGRLAAGVAHEINTPIQYVGDSIRYIAEVFSDTQKLMAKYREVLSRLTNSSGHEAIDEIRKAEQDADLTYSEVQLPKAFAGALDGVSRIASIVSAMKEFAHPDHEEKGMADLNRALVSTLAIARNEYKYVADVETEFGELPPVECHLGELNQVFLNLLINAAHAISDVVGQSGNRGRIRVRTAIERNGMVRVEIGDTGCGIPPAIRDRVFDPFFTTKEVGHGSGQGLAIARSIVVDKHQGSLTFESEVGTGTTFTILLPVTSDREKAAQ